VEEEVCFMGIMLQGVLLTSSQRKEISSTQEVNSSPEVMILSKPAPRWVALSTIYPTLYQAVIWIRTGIGITAKPKPRILVWIWTTILVTWWDSIWRQAITKTTPDSPERWKRAILRQGHQERIHYHQRTLPMLRITMFKEALNFSSSMTACLR